MRSSTGTALAEGARHPFGTRGFAREVPPRPGPAATTDASLIPGQDLPEGRERPGSPYGGRSTVHQDGHPHGLGDLLLGGMTASGTKGMSGNTPVALPGHRDRQRNQLFDPRRESAVGENRSLHGGVAAHDLRDLLASSRAGSRISPMTSRGWIMDASLDACSAVISGAVRIDGKRNPALVGRLRTGLTWILSQLLPTTGHACGASIRWFDQPGGPWP